MPVNRRVLIRAAGAVAAAIVAVVLAQRETVSPERWSPALDEQWVETSVTVYRLLPDDNEGSRHQRLLARTDGGHSLLIVHNIDLARRVPADVGDRLDVRGQFEWTDKGGLVHWTHHDPQGRHAGGYIDFGGTRYR